MFKCHWTTPFSATLCTVCKTFHYWYWVSELAVDVMADDLAFKHCVSYSMTKNFKRVGSHTVETTYGESTCITFLPYFNILYWQPDDGLRRLKHVAIQKENYNSFRQVLKLNTEQIKVIMQNHIKIFLLCEIFIPHGNQCSISSTAGALLLAIMSGFLYTEWITEALSLGVK